MAQDILGVDQVTLREYRNIIREGLHTTVEQGLQMETRLGQACLARFDPTSFGKQRKAVMGRGRGQTGQSS
jgi:hypothetical protein